MNNQLKVFEHEQFGQVRAVNDGKDIWFVAKDITDVLSLSNTTVALQNLEKFERTKSDLGPQGKTNLINESGVLRLINSSRKVNTNRKIQIIKWLDLTDKEIITSVPEAEFGEQLVLFMNKLECKVITQFNVLNYCIDFYIPELNIAIEYDELQHKYHYKKDKQRELEIQKEIGCKFIRIDDGLNIGTQLGLIMKFIMKNM